MSICEEAGRDVQIPLDERDNWSLGERGKSGPWIPQTRGNTFCCLANAEKIKSPKEEDSSEFSGFD